MSSRLLTRIVLLTCAAVVPGCGEQRPEPPTAAADEAGGASEPAEAAEPGTAPAVAPEPAGPVRIVLITLDTLRLDAVALMPGLADWSRKGTVFERYYSCSSTTQPAHATLLTGLHPWEHGVTANGMVLDAARETLAERMAAAGFRSGAVVASFPVHGDFGFSQGFDLYDNDFGGGEGPARNNRNLHSSAAQVTDRALAQLEALGGARQFLWVHYFDPHSPYGDHQGVRGVGASPGKILDGIAAGEYEAEERVAWAKRLYDGDLGYLDRHLMRLVRAIERRDDGFETHVVVVSDHGESFGEGGSMGHGKRLTPEQIHVPLIVRSPRLAAGVREEPVGSADVAATLLELAGIEDGTANGHSLLRAARPQRAILGQRRSFAEAYAELRIDGREHPLEMHQFFLAQGDRVVTGNSAAVSSWDSGEPIEDAELAARCRELFAELERYVLELDTATLEDVESLEALRSLGYTR